MATNQTFENPVLPVSSNVNIVRNAANHAIGLGQQTAAASAAESTRGVLQYVPGASGAADQLLVNLKSDGDNYVNRDLVLPVLGRRRIYTGASVLTLTELESGGVIMCGAAEDFVLPTITAANVGMEFDFRVNVVASSLTITAAATQLLVGGVGMDSSTAGDGEHFTADGTDDLIMTMNGTTQGGIVGSFVRFLAVSITQWHVTGNLLASGTMVTPFS
jgi:hypothetical protein